MGASLLVEARESHWGSGSSGSKPLPSMDQGGHVLRCSAEGKHKNVQCRPTRVSCFKASRCWFWVVLSCTSCRIL